MADPGLEPGAGAAGFEALAPAVIAAAEAAAPLECCGAVLVDARGAAQVWRGTNRRASATAFELEVALLLAAARAELRLVALYHSHPAGPPRPSGADVAAVAGPDGPLWPGVEHWIAGRPEPGRSAGWTLARFAWCAHTSNLAPATGPLPPGLALGSSAPAVEAVWT